SPVGVVVRSGPGVDQHLDLAIAGDVGERVRHLVVGLPVPHQAAALGVALHEQDALLAQLEAEVGVLILVLRKSRSLGHPALLFIWPRTTSGGSGPRCHGDRACRTTRSPPPSRNRWWPAPRARRAGSGRAWSPPRPDAAAQRSCGRQRAPRRTPRRPGRRDSRGRSAPLAPR